MRPSDTEWRRTRSTQPSGCARSRLMATHALHRSHGRSCVIARERPSTPRRAHRASPMAQVACTVPAPRRAGPHVYPQRGVNARYMPLHRTPRRRGWVLLDGQKNVRSPAPARGHSRTWDQGGEDTQKLLRRTMFAVHPDRAQRATLLYGRPRRGCTPNARSHAGSAPMRCRSTCPRRPRGIPRHVSRETLTRCRVHGAPRLQCGPVISTVRRNGARSCRVSRDTRRHTRCRHLSVGRRLLTPSTTIREGVATDARHHRRLTRKAGSTALGRRRARDLCP